MNYYLLNVFTKDGENGNQLAAVLLDRKISDLEMQSIAKNFNFSETIFIDIENEIDVRIFTPNSELPFAGHPTVGASWLLKHLGKVSDDFSFKVPLGKLFAKANSRSGSVVFPGSPKISKLDSRPDNLLSHSNVMPQDVFLDDIKLVNAGPEFTVIPVRNHTALKNAHSPVSLAEPHKAYFIFEESTEKFAVRMFAPHISVNEDAATGSAACALAGYLRDYKYRESGNLVISQGREMNRECEIHLTWDKKSVSIGGNVLLWAQGQLLL